MNCARRKRSLPRQACVRGVRSPRGLSVFCRPPQAPRERRGAGGKEKEGGREEGSEKKNEEKEMHYNSNKVESWATSNK